MWMDKEKPGFWGALMVPSLCIQMEWNGPNKISGQVAFALNSGARVKGS